MMDFLSLPKAQIQGCPSGTLNLAKLHLELKYLGSKPPAFAILCVNGKGRVFDVVIIAVVVIMWKMPFVVKLFQCH